MGVQFREMSEEEFKIFFENSINDYINDLIKSSVITMEEALAEAKREFAEMLPNGLGTADNALRIIVDAAEEKAVGVIWYLFEMTDDVKQVFLSDFIINEEERRKGYASVALTEMERDALRNDCAESIIYVRKHNLPAINLYTKCGYVAFRELDDGMYMKKRIGKNMNIKELIDSNFRGNVYIVQDNKVLCENVTGFADLANEIPNSLETKFASASAGKVFVAVGILQLIEQGKIKLDDTLGMLLDIPLNNIDKDVTVKQLLNHTSGVPDYFDESVMDEYEELWIDYPNYKIRRNSDLLPLFINKPMMYPKGEKFQYNNSGYVLLAMIIEKVTGMYFDKYLKENIFDICDMKSTGYYELDKLPSKCANNYIYCADTNDYRTNIFSVDVKGTGAGGAFITVKDIISFWTNLLEGNLISKAFVSDMLSKQSGEGDDTEEGYYGYGMWIIDNHDGMDFAYFQGCDPGVSFISEYNPNNGIISVLVSNYGDNVWREMRKIREVLY